MICKQFQFQVLVVLAISKFYACDISRINCVMYESNRKCAISGLTVTSKNYTFVPVSPDSNIVVKFELTKSIVPVLTSNICTTLTKLKSFSAIDQNIETVEDYAFNNCTDVVDINLEKNNIHKLGVGVFSNTKKLERLHLLGGSLSRIDVDLLSNLSELNQLLYSANGLKELPIDAIKHLKKLGLLYIYSNDLTDLDAEGLVANLPSLKTIYLNDNNFHCDRLIEILDVFKTKNIRVSAHTYEKHIKKRDYIPRKINGIICLTQAQLEDEKLKKVLSDSLNDLKDLPLGKEIIQLKEVVNSGFLDSDSEIVSLSNSLNATSDNLYEQISNLNGTLKNNSIEITDTVGQLRANIDTVQHVLEQNLRDKSELLRKHEEAIAALKGKLQILMSESASSPSALNAETVGNGNIITVWACLAVLFLINLGMWLWVIRKLKNASVDVPLVCYEEQVDRHNHQRLHETFA